MRSLSLNENWHFMKLPGLTLSALPDALPDDPWTPVTLPHTWFSDDDPYQGLTVYETTIRRDTDEPKAYLSFDAADQRCRVFVNGVPAGSHAGGYARFRLPVPDAVMADRVWTIRVYLDNSADEDVIPFFGDFTVFGGLYRGAQLLLCQATHFDYGYFGTDGLIVRTDVGQDGRGVLTLAPHTVCAAARCHIEYRLLDERGETVGAAQGGPAETVTLTVDRPTLWDGVGHAHFYTVAATLYADGEVADRTEVRTGFRRVTVDGQQGLALNGRACPLRGVARHQDRAGVYSAVSLQHIREDFSIIREMGANAVRLSHYQHPQAAYDCCDELGLLCWAEIPMLKMTESPALLDNTLQQLTELILQNIHHPAIFCWGIQNEIAMFRDAPYMHESCRRLHELVRELDPGRFSAAANLYPLKASSRLNDITDMVGYNVYFGWYYGEMTGYGPYLDRFHAARPLLPLGISEYGVDANLRLHSESPRVKDYSEEYQALWHETVYPQIESRAWLWGSFVWNMFDFSSVRRNEGGQKYINAKGLVSHDRQVRKDAYYYYQARWTDAPFVHLCARRFVNRAREAIDVKCYTNQPTVTLTVNGRPFGEAQADNGTVLFRNVPLAMGENRIEAMAGGCRDAVCWRRVSEPDPEYCLPGQEAGGAVRNWFLADDDMRREGFFSVQSTAQDLLNNPEARRVLEKYIPALVRFMTEKSVIPLGLSLKSILSRESDGTLDMNALNAELNQIPDTEV